MSILMLLGASGLAREVMAVESALGRYDEVFLLDDDPTMLGHQVGGTCVIGPLSLAADDFDGDLLICVGSSRGRRAVASRLAAMGVGPQAYATVVHPSVEIPHGCSIGAGSIVLAGTVLTANVHVHRHVVVMPHVTLTHDVVVSDFATLCAGVSLGGRVTVESGAYIGMNAGVRQDVTVGRDSVLGMGGVLLRDLPEGETWGGVPARNLAVSRKELV